MKSMNRIPSLALFALALAGAASLGAAPLKFDFKDPKGVNNVQFHLDAPLESISGQSTGITGDVTFDPANVAATTGKITIDAKTLTVGNGMMKDHMLSAGWIDAAKFPEITFELTALQNVKTTDAKSTADASGKLTLHGVTKEITVPVSLSYLEGKLGSRVKGANGDLLVVRTNFSINRSDYGIKAGQNLDTVSDKIDLALSLAGAHAK